MTCFYLPDFYSDKCYIYIHVGVIMTKAGLSEEAAVVNLTSSQGTVDRLTESKIICTLEDKVGKTLFV